MSSTDEFEGRTLWVEGRCWGKAFEKNKIMDVKRFGEIFFVEAC